MLFILQIGQTKAILLPMKSGRYQKLRQKLNSVPSYVRRWICDARFMNQKIILYITTNLFQHNWYGGYNPPFSDHYFANSQKGLLGSLSKLSGARIIVKLHENPEYRLPPWIEEWKNKANILLIKNELSVPILSHLADIILIDWPTTALLETLTVKRPIFVLTKRLRLKDKAYNLLKKRAICSSSTEQIIMAIYNYMENTYYPSDVDNDEYLKAYGTYFDDGKSAQRAENRVLEVISYK